jgi:hypothetical protein
MRYTLGDRVLVSLVTIFVHELIMAVLRLSSGQQACTVEHSMELSLALLFMRARHENISRT